MEATDVVINGLCALVDSRLDEESDRRLRENGLRKAIADKMQERVWK